MWYLGDTSVPIPQAPGTYTVTLDPGGANALDPDVDLSVDHQGGFKIAIPDADIFGDAFSFTVLPEPASLILLAAGLILLRRK